MPLESESNIPKQSEPAAPLSVHERLSDDEKRFALGWMQMGYAERLERFRKLSPNLSPDIRATLVAIVLTPTSRAGFGAATAKQFRREVLTRLLQEETPELLKSLAPLLFDADAEVQSRVFEAFRRAKRSAIPILKEALPGGLKAINPYSEAKRKGVLGVLRLLADAKDPRSVEMVGEMLNNNMPLHTGRMERFAKSAAIAAGVILGGAGALLAFVMGLAGFLVALFLGIIGASAVYVFLYMLFSPFVAVRDQRLYNDFTKEALWALRQIGDKRALLYLMAYYKVGGSFYSAIVKLLPLLEEDDRKWLGLYGRAWLSQNLRETSPDTTLVLLKATRILGNEEFIAPVRRMSKRARSPEVREEALRVLSALEARFNAQKERRELLRASNTPDEAPETLLRPLQERHDPQEARELLRPLESRKEE